MEPVYLTMPEPASGEHQYFTNEIIADDQGGGVAAPTREEMFESAGGAMKFESRARRVFRHGPSAAMVRQLLYWSDKGHDPEGYVYKTYSEWWEEEGLSRTELDTARRKLGERGVGVLDEKRKGIPCRLYYRLDLSRLWELMFPELQGPGGNDPVPEDQTLNHDYRVQGSDEQDCGDAASKIAGSTPSIYRDYAKTTSIEPSGKCAHTKGSSSPTPQHVEESPASNNVIELQEKRPPKSSSEIAVSKLVRGVEDAGGGITRSSRGKYGGQFKRLVENDGVTEDELEQVVDRIVSEWSRIELSAEQALSDVLNGRDSNENAGRSSSKASSGPATPEPALEALRGDSKYGRYAHLAERHDFTSQRAPEWKILQECGGTEQERRDNARRMGNVARNAMNRAEREASGESKPSSEGSFREGYEWFFDQPVSGGRKQMFDN